MEDEINRGIMPTSGTHLSTDNTSGVNAEVPVDSLFDLFGFEDAHKRQKESEKETLLSEPAFMPWRVFINQIDSYHGKKLVDYLPEQSYISQGQREGEARGEKVDEEMGGEDEEEEMIEVPSKLSKNFEVIGTVRDREYPLPEDVTKMIKHERDRESFLPELMKCGFIIYDITQDQSQITEAQWALEAIASELEKSAEEMPKAFKRNEPIRHFILISTIMTWALTKPLDPEESELPFTEEDYRKRKSHANFKKHILLEKDVLGLKKRAKLKDKLKTLVLCCGVTYGDEEGPLHYLFRMGWHNAPELPIFGKGNNEIPLLHVQDLVTIQFAPFLTSATKGVHYFGCTIESIVNFTAIPESKRINALKRINCRKISTTLTSGRVKNIAHEEAFLLKDVDQQNYDMVTVNLRMEPVYILEQNILWHSELPFDENIEGIVREYKAARNLRPVNLIVLGPPAVGKTRLARILAKHYQIHYISVKAMITEIMEKLSSDIEAAMASQLEEHDHGTGDKDRDEDEREDKEIGNEDEGELPNVAEWQKQLHEIRSNLADNNGRLDDNVLNKIFMKRLMSKSCQNQGFVIDGYPKTLAQAKSLFGSGEVEENVAAGEEGEESDNALPEENVIMMPEVVIALEASDEFLKKRILCLQEREIQNTHYTEEHMIRRLQEYRKRNTDDNTPLQFFDELEIHPLVLFVEDDPCPEMFSSFCQSIRKIGKPRNYGLTPEDVEELRRRAEAETLAEAAIEETRQTEKVMEQKKAREAKMMEWTNLMEKLTQEEEEQLCVLGEPLRHYLVKYVFPTMTQGLQEVAKLRPGDPVDYLAEYLFKENPAAKMFEPDYTETMNMFLGVIEDHQNDILPQEQLDETMEKYFKTTENVSITGSERDGKARDERLNLGTFPTIKETSDQG